MLHNKEILEIARSLIKKRKLNLKVKFLPYKDFIKLSKKSPLIRKVLAEGNDFYDLDVPSIFSHKTDTIYFDKKILTKLLHDEPQSIQKRFIESITYHEIFHFINKQKLKDKSLNSALLSEEKAERDFKKYFPGLSALGKRIAKKYINT
ncbi:MAG: hypothetical protein ABIB47_02760 [Candidatus Woesearchaeota archaeon]